MSRIVLGVLGVSAAVLVGGLGCKSASGDNSKVIARVAGEKVTEKGFETIVKVIVGDEAKAKDVLSSEPMRTKRNEFLGEWLKGKALMAMAKAEGLDKDPALQTRLEQATAMAYLQVLVEKRLEKVKATDADLKAFYDKQVSQIPEEMRAKGVPPFEQVKPQLEAMMKKEKETEVYEKLMQEALAKSPITYSEGYNPVVVAAPKLQTPEAPKDAPKEATKEAPKTAGK